MKLTHASTFSGIGAPEVAADMLGWDNLFHCEINPFGRAVLDYYFPNAKSYEDITKTDFSEWRGKVNVLTGGFPCQPFSYAGNRRGSEDDRYLWPYMLRCIEQVQPDWFIGENVAGITTMVFPGEDVTVGSNADLFGESYNTYERHEPYVLNDICEGLERAGYSVQPILIPACAVGAPHRRDRVWIIAHRDAVLEDTLHGGQLERGDDEQGSKRNEWNAGARSDERLCGRTSGTEMRLATDTNSAGQSASNGSSGRERTEVDGERKDQSLVGAGRYGTNETATDTNLQRCNKSIIAKEPSKKERFDSEADIDWGNKDGHVTDTGNERCEQTGIEGAVEAKASSKHQPNHITDYEGLLPANRWRTFPTVSPVYRGNDGLPFDVDDLTIPWLKSKKHKDHFNTWKKESLKAYGNAWCVQVGYEIMRAIDELETLRLNNNN